MTIHNEPHYYDGHGMDAVWLSRWFTMTEGRLLHTRFATQDPYQKKVAEYNNIGSCFVGLVNC